MDNPVSTRLARVESHTNTHTDRHMNTYTQNQTDTHMYTDRQEDIHRHTNTDRHTDRQTYTYKKNSKFNFILKAIEIYCVNE